MKRYSPDEFMYLDEINNVHVVFEPDIEFYGAAWPGGVGDSVYEFEDDDNDDPTIYIKSTDGRIIHDKLMYVKYVEDLETPALLKTGKY